MAYNSTSGIADFGFLPPNFNGDVQTFDTPHHGQGSSKWIKPRGVTMCYMVCIGGGGGGGGGKQAASTNARGGGAGGACSSISILTMPIFLLPDVLWIQVGNGGIGGTGGTSPTGGASGVNSYISYGAGLTGISTIPNIILQSNNAAPGGGNAGGTSGNATGGTVPTIATAALQGAATSWCIPQFLVGIVGSTGGVATGGTGTLVTAWATMSLSAGAGGAGVNSLNGGFTGGQIFTTGNAALDFADGVIIGNTLVAGGTAGGAGAAGNGNPGIQYWKPFYISGGSGGGSSDGSTAGNGGKGGIGCGGGGGGGGATAGNGGDGGPGFVQIICW